MTRPTLPRRTLAASLAAVAAALASRPAASAPLADALRHALPPGLDLHAVGAALRAAHPACTAADCRARARLPSLDALPTRIAADFANGDTITVDGWILSRTEAWFCAALI